MKKIGLFNRSLTLLTLMFVLALGLLMCLPPDVLYASTTEDKSAESTEQIDETAGASVSTTTEQVDETAGASVPKFEHYEPLSIEPIHRDANNVLLGSGLMIAALIIGGAFVMDKRNGY